MSTELFKMMWKRFPEGGSSLVVMMAIAKSADSEGVCHFTTRDLAAVARMSRTSAWRLLAELESKGWVVVDPPATKTGPATIRLRLAMLEEQGDVPQPLIKRSIPRCVRKSATSGSLQGELIFSPAVNDPEPTSSELGQEGLSRKRKIAAPQQCTHFRKRPPALQSIVYPRMRRPW